MTFHLLHTSGKVRANDIVLIHAIGDGVQLNLTLRTKYSEAKVVEIVGTTRKEKRPLECGADLDLDRTKQQFT